MSLIQTCKCEECGAQKSFANHWVMLFERNGNLVIVPVWNDKLLRRTQHFCGRAHASRYVERWIANPATASLAEGAAAEVEAPNLAHFPPSAETWLDDEAEAMAARASVRYA